uniref:Uncharacterized protein n=1 Tax=Hemiselmis andersenii TaxID=464988 RepID=A0A7S1HBN3_HEMAN
MSHEGLVTTEVLTPRGGIASAWWERAGCFEGGLCTLRAAREAMEDNLSCKSVASGRDIVPRFRRILFASSRAALSLSDAEAPPPPPAPCPRCSVEEKVPPARLSCNSPDFVGF